MSEGILKGADMTIEEQAEILRKSCKIQTRLVLESYLENLNDIKIEDKVIKEQADEKEN